MFVVSFYNSDFSIDAILLAAAYGSTPSDPNWNPDADLNGYDVVNILDAIILAAHYNEEWA